MNETINFHPISEIIRQRDLRTIEELEKHPYPSNVQLLCYKGGLSKEGGDNAERLANNRNPGFVASKDQMDDSDYLLPCAILKIKNKLRCDVQIIQDTGYTVLENYPQNSIAISMRPYTSDQHLLESSFRHFIEISDDIFPEKWKNLS